VLSPRDCAEGCRRCGSRTGRSRGARAAATRTTR
jgi:hypothetical protein